MVNYSPPELPGALARGEVDGIVIWEPHGSRALELLGENATTIDISSAYTTTFNFLTNEYFLEEKGSEILVRFLRAVEMATNFIAENKVESQALVAARLNRDIALVTKFWDDFVFELSMNQAWLTNIEREARWAIDSGLVGEQSGIPNYLNYTYPAALKAVNPTAVNIIH